MQDDSTGSCQLICRILRSAAVPSVMLAKTKLHVPLTCSAMHAISLGKLSSSVGLFCSASTTSVMLAKSERHPLSRFTEVFKHAVRATALNITLSPHLLHCLASSPCSITQAETFSHAPPNHATRASHTVSSIQKRSFSSSVGFVGLCTSPSGSF